MHFLPDPSLLLTYSVILLWLTLDDFTREGEKSGSEKVKDFLLNPLPTVDVLHYFILARGR